MSNSFSPPPLQRDFTVEVGGRQVVDPLWAKWLQDLWTSLNTVNSTLATGTGAVVHQTSPTLITPTLGVAQGTSLALTGDITTGDAAALHKTSVSMNNGAAAAVGTLNNAPAIGNPTKWIPINDNGVTRYIPTW